MPHCFGRTLLLVALGACFGPLCFRIVREVSIPPSFAWSSTGTSIIAKITGTKGVGSWPSDRQLLKGQWGSPHTLGSEAMRVDVNGALNWVWVLIHEGRGHSAPWEEPDISLWQAWNFLPLAARKLTFSRHTPHRS